MNLCKRDNIFLSLYRYYPINQELSVLYGGPTLIYGGQLSLYAPHMIRVIWQEIWHICNCLIYRVKSNIYAARLIYREKECLYAERNGYFFH